VFILAAGGLASGQAAASRALGWIPDLDRLPDEGDDVIASEDIIEWAGPDGIARAKPEAVSKWDISDEEKEVLLHVGLPRQVGSFFEASIQEQEEPAVTSKTHGALYRIGWDLGAHIAVGRGFSGVFAIYPDGELPVFVNNTLVHLAIFLHETGKTCGDRTWMSEEDWVIAVANLKARLLEVDPPALPSDLQSWWSLVFEQIEEGLL
jgi:SUKH-4 immunity protein